MCLLGIPDMAQRSTRWGTENLGKYYLPRFSVPYLVLLCAISGFTIWPMHALSFASTVTYPGCSTSDSNALLSEDTVPYWYILAWYLNRLVLYALFTGDKSRTPWYYTTPNDRTDPGMCHLPQIMYSYLLPAHMSNMVIVKNISTPARLRRRDRWSSNSEAIKMSVG